MTINEYLQECILLLTVSPVVERFQVLKMKEVETDGYLRARAILVDKSLLEISIYCQHANETICLAGYRFHWQDKEKNLIKRWDNAKHHPELATFPGHVHLGNTSTVEASEAIDLSCVLKILESELNIKNI